MSNVLISAMKNEGTFILEWVAYHKAIGFDRIVILSNDCDDDSHLLLDALAEADVVEHIRHKPPPQVSAQASAAMRVNDLGLLREGDWVSWLDADEFLNVKVGTRDVPALIEAIGSAKGILIQWRCFGDNGHARFPGRHISANFVTASRENFTPCLQIKTFFLMGPWIAGLSNVGIHRPALKPDNGLSSADFITSAGRSLDPDFGPTSSWLKGENPAATSDIAWKERGWKLAQINHYIVRTPEHFKMKSSRGRGWRADAAGKKNKRHTPQFYAKMNQNEVVDRSILFHAASVDVQLRNLLAIEAVAAAQARVTQRTQELLEPLTETLHPLPIVNAANRTSEDRDRNGA